MISNGSDAIQFVQVDSTWFVTVSHGSIVVFDDSDLSQEMPRTHIGVLLYIDMNYWNAKAQEIVDYYFKEFLV